MCVEKNAARTLYCVSLTLNVPGRTLAAHKERPDFREAVREAFTEIERAFTKHKEKLAAATQAVTSSDRRAHGEPWNSNHVTPSTTTS